MQTADVLPLLLDDLQALAEALASGMQALATHRLDTFAHLHASQLQLCTRVQRHTTALQQSPADAEASAHPLRASIHQAAAQVHQLQRQYACYLRHAVRLVRARVVLARSQTVGVSAGSAPRWSCEA